MSMLQNRPLARTALFYGIGLCSLVLTACATAPESPLQAAETRKKLSMLQTHAELAGRARPEVQEAEMAVRLAEQPLPSGEAALAAHRIYLAESKIAIAEAKATTEFAEEQRALLSQTREDARLRARTAEVDSARSATSLAREETRRAREATASAQDEAAAARRDTAAAQSASSRTEALAARDAVSYQRQIDLLEAATTERGLVLTLGDVLFATDSAELYPGAHGNLDKLVTFLEQNPGRRVLIEGHTDNVGNSDYNRSLSQRRAESVSSYLRQHGIASLSLSASGIGMARPIASNDTATGRQQNRRVEIIIENP